MILGMFDSDAVPLIPAELINHSAPLAIAPPGGVTAEYGKYLVSIALCTMCHGNDLKGGPPIDVGIPPGPDIVMYASQGLWSVSQSLSTIRTGVNPYGKTLNPEFMPVEVYEKMTDDELLAIWQYIISISDN